MLQNYKEIRLVFDRYITYSLRRWARNKCTSGNEIRCHINGDTNIANISLKQLLSYIETKQQLTIYLSEHVISEFKRLSMDYIGSYDVGWTVFSLITKQIRLVSIKLDSISKTNQQGLLAENLHCLHEEADTLLIIHYWQIAGIRYPLNQSIFYSPDTCFSAFDISLLMTSACIDISHW